MLSFKAFHQKHFEECCGFFMQFIKAAQSHQELNSTDSQYWPYGYFQHLPSNTTSDNPFISNYYGYQYPSNWNNNQHEISAKKGNFENERDQDEEERNERINEEENGEERNEDGESEEQEADDEEEVRLVLTQEAIEFFARSEMNREKRKREKLQKEKDEQEEQKRLKKFQETSSVHSHEEQIRKVYGDRAPKILALESSLDEKFDELCAAYSPTLWPHLAIRC
jgi:hypothetical protein